MPKSPFFSIVIPTRNRSQIIGFALDSVLKQTFTDFEVIVVDNDLSETATKEAVAPYLRDARVRYVRSGGLSMADNWEFGLEYVRGEYVTYMEDKQVLLRHALEKMHEKTAKNNFCEVLTWRWGTFDVGKYTNFVWQFEPNYEEILDSEEIVRRFAEENLYTYGFPVPHGSAIKTVVIRRIQNSPLKRFCSVISPDVTSAFAVLGCTEKIVFISDALSVMHQKQLGNAFRCMQDVKLFEKFLVESNFDASKWHKDLPVKFHTVPNVGFNDFLFVRDAMSGKLAKYDVSNVNYFVQNFININEWIEKGVMEYVKIKQIFEEAVELLSTDEKAKINAQLANIKTNPQKKNDFLPVFLKDTLSYVKNNILDDAKKFKILSRNGRSIVFQKSFKNINEYLDWEFENYQKNIPYSSRL